MGASNSLYNSRGKAVSAYIPAFRKGALIYAENIQSGVLLSSHFGGGMISALVAGSVTSAYIGTSAVTNTKIKANAIRAGAISANAVTSAKIGVSAVTNVKIKSNAVRAAHISANAVTSAKIKAAWLSGTLVSGKTTRTVAHGLGVKPKFAIVNALPTLAQGISATRIDIYLAAASAATSTNIYIIGTQPTNAALKYVAYVQA